MLRKSLYSSRTWHCELKKGRKLQARRSEGEDMVQEDKIFFCREVDFYAVSKTSLSLSDFEMQEQENLLKVVAVIVVE